MPHLLGLEGSPRRTAKGGGSGCERLNLYSIFIYLVSSLALHPPSDYSVGYGHFSFIPFLCSMDLMFIEISLLILVLGSIRCCGYLLRSDLRWKYIFFCCCCCWIIQICNPTSTFVKFSTLTCLPTWYASHHQLAPVVLHFVGISLVPFLAS